MYAKQIKFDFLVGDKTQTNSTCLLRYPCLSSSGEISSNRVYTPAVFLIPEWDRSWTNRLKIQKKWTPPGPEGSKLRSVELLKRIMVSWVEKSTSILNVKHWDRLPLKDNSIDH